MKKKYSIEARTIRGVKMYSGWLERQSHADGKTLLRDGTGFYSSLEALRQAHPVFAYIPVDSSDTENQTDEA
jgi:hypothetical protein